MFTCTLSPTKVILNSTGKEPPFISSFITSMDLSLIFDKDIKVIQDYYVSITKKKNKYYIIASKDKKDVEDNKTIKQRKWVGEAQQLDFSESTTEIKDIKKNIKPQIENNTFLLHTLKNNIKNVFLKNIFIIFLLQILTSMRKLRFNNKKMTLTALETKLIEKNVSIDIVQNLLEEYTKDKNIHDYLVEKLEKIIRKYDTNNLLAQIEDTKPFTIAFIGINGVGKTTTLGKLIRYLHTTQHSIVVGACDTFRSGAIEQLQQICNHKDVELYHRGYNKDDSKIVAETIAHAKNKKVDVVLIDTAGRMHTKHHLMESLKKIYNNKIHHTIFVSEALIGNESINIINEFNKIVKIDSLIITKLDTVDNKIGHIINLTATVNKPILFLGTGQNNRDLEEVDVERIVEKLLE